MKTDYGRVCMEAYTNFMLNNLQPSAFDPVPPELHSRAWQAAAEAVIGKALSDKAEPPVHAGTAVRLPAYLYRNELRQLSLRAGDDVRVVLCDGTRDIGWITSAMLVALVKQLFERKEAQ